MIHAQNTKTVLVIQPQSVASTATATGNIDTLGFRYCAVDFCLDSNAATTAPIALKLTESDDTVATNFAAIATFTGGTATSTSAGFVIPAAVTAADQKASVRMHVDLRGRKRYLKASLTPGTTNTCTIIAHLWRAEEAPNSAAEYGANAFITG